MKLYKDKTFLVFGIAAGLFSLVIYYLTKAPTLSFWDCGEFIACSKILGVPHPPGTPLYILIGRFFTLLPLPFGDAVKVNIISVTSSAATVFVAYWLIIRLIAGFKDEKLNIWRKLALSVGGFSGSLVIAFSSTFWDNAVEAEVYGLAMMLMLILCYMLLIWSNRIGQPSCGKYIVAVSYLSFLGIGIHMTTFLVVPVFVLYMAIKDRSLLTDWRFWLTWIILLMVTTILDIFLYGVAALVVVSGILVFTAKKSPYMLRLVFALTLATVVGYSTHLYLPIRAQQKPAINENNPDDWQRFKSLLERKQYGQESMITRMFHRRGTWTNQFGAHPHMGFGGYFREQYSKIWAAFLFFAIGIWGIYEAIRRERINGIWMLFLFLISSLGLVLYLNFSDGTRGAILEVRNRDYFFTPGFMFFGLFIGVGITGLLSDLSVWIKDRPVRKYLFISALVVALLFPIHTLLANYFTHDRSRNFIPWDYAYNILISVDKGGVVFTNGDNDTFPLWYLQEVEKIRTDVKVVNLSLLNTPWYIHQLKDQMGVPISYSYEEIEKLRPIWLPDKEKVWKVQDQMVRHIIQTNKWQIPIYFAVTVSTANKLGLDDHLIMEGMAYRIVPSKGENRIDLDLMWKRYMEECRFRGLNDPTMYKGENDNRLVANYVSGFLQLADTLKNAGRIDEAIEAARKGVDIYPDEWRSRAYLAGLYVLAGQTDSIDSVVEGFESGNIENIYINAARELLLKQKWEESKSLLYKALQYNPKSKMAFNNLMIVEDQINNYQAVDSLAEMWRQLHKNDPAALAELENLLRALESRREN